MLEAIPIKTSPTHDGGHVQCPNCKAILFIAWRNHEHNSDSVICDCGVPLAIPIERTLTIYYCDKCGKLVGECACR